MQCLLIVFFILGHQTEVKSQEIFKVQRLSSPIVFDGRPFEEEWTGKDYNKMVMFKPNFGIEPTEESEILITYDDDYLWIGARLFMKDATQIATTSRKRDDQPRSPDHFAILIDGYNHKENGYVFMTNPEGTRIDISVANDAANFSAINITWNTFWDVETSRDDNGWYVEMRIPFSSLRFTSENNVIRMGVIMKRCFSSNAEIDTYPALDPKYGSIPFLKPSLASIIEIENVEPSNPVYISPYLIGGFSRDWTLNTEETQYIHKDNPDFNAGIDMKYNFKSNLTLDLTVNTDFAQVEADDQQVNLTRYSLFFPEKRMFFQERSDIFSYSLGGNSNLFYSRRIGLSPSGEPIRIYGGARLVGKIGRWDLGIMDMQTEKNPEIPAENMGVVRLRRQVINPNSYIGGIFSSRLGMNGSQNFAYGLDGIFRLFGVDYLEVKAAQTYDSEIDNSINTKEPVFASATWERRSARGLAYNLGYFYTGKDFKPGIGFVTRGGQQGLSGKLLYGWFPGIESKIYSTTIAIAANRYTRLEDGKLETTSVTPSIKVQLKSNFVGELAADYQEEGVLYSFPISDSVRIMPGFYTFTELNIGLQTPSSKPFYVTLNINTGKFYHGNRHGFTFSPVIDLSRSIQLSGSYQYNKILVPEQVKPLNIHLARVKLVYMLNTKLSLSAYMQYTNSYNNLVSNLRIRYNPREGNDFYLVFNDYRGVINDDLELDLPDLSLKCIE